MAASSYQRLREHLAGYASEIVKAPGQPLQAGRPRLIDGEADCRRPAATEDGHHGVQLHGLVAERPRAELGPVHLGLHAGVGLEADFRVAYHRRTE